MSAKATIRLLKLIPRFFGKFMEKELRLKTKDGHIVYGVLNSTKNRSKKLVIFVHGLTGHPNQHTFYNAAKFFPKKGFSTFRFDLYSGEKRGRLLTHTSIKQHAEDLNLVIEYFRKKYKKLFLVGHSLGGVTILQADYNKSDGIVLWDSSVKKKYHLVGIDDTIRYNKALGKYILKWREEYLISKAMNREMTRLPEPKDLVAAVKVPIKIIVAGKGILVRGGREYYKHASEPKDFALIKNAGHSFNEEGAEEQLFSETLAWVKKFTK